MNRSHAICVLLVLGSSVPASAQTFAGPLCDPAGSVCGVNCMDELNAGDSNSSLTSLSAGELTAFTNRYSFDIGCHTGEEACFNAMPGGGDMANTSTALRRMTNAVALTAQIPFFGDPNRTWEDVTAGEHVVDIEPYNECPTKNASSWGGALTCRIWVYIRGLMTRPVWDRAATFVHEVRHCHDHVLTGHHNCGGSNNCDFRWSDEGAWQWGVSFLANFAAFAPPSWSPVQRAVAIGTANVALSSRFVEHPGFLFYVDAEANVRTYSLDGPPSSTRYEYLAADAPSPDYPIQRIAIHYERVEVQTGLFHPVVTGLDIHARALLPDGTFGPPLNVSLGAPTTYPGSPLVIDTANVGPNRVITRLHLGWVAEPVTVGTQGLATAEVMTARVSPAGDRFDFAPMNAGGAPGPCGTGACPTGWVCAPPPCTSCDPICESGVIPTGYEAPAGQFLVGFGIGAESGTDTFASLTTQSAGTQVWLEPIGQIAEFPSSFSCASDETAVGGLFADGLDDNPAFLGMVGLFCAPTASVAAGALIDPATLRLVHPGDWAMPGGELVAADFGPFYDMLTDRSLATRYCDPGEAVAGLLGREGWLVDRVDGLRCRNLATGVETDRGVFYGGFGGIPFVRSCPAGRTIGGGKAWHLEGSYAAVELRCR